MFGNHVSQSFVGLAFIATPPFDSIPLVQLRPSTLLFLQPYSLFLIPYSSNLIPYSSNLIPYSSNLIPYSFLTPNSQLITLSSMLSLPTIFVVVAPFFPLVLFVFGGLTFGSCFRFFALAFSFPTLFCFQTSLAGNFAGSVELVRPAFVV